MIRFGILSSSLVARPSQEDAHADRLAAEGPALARQQVEGGSKAVSDVCQSGSPAEDRGSDFESGLADASSTYLQRIGFKFRRGLSRRKRATPEGRPGCRSIFWE